MSNIIKSNFSVNYIEEELNKTTRFFDTSISHEPLSYEHGEVTLPGNTTEHELISNVNLFHILSESPVTIKIGDTTAPSYTNMRQLSYDGSLTTVFISNENTDPVKVQFVSAKFNLYYRRM